MSAESSSEKLLYVFSRGPYSVASGQEALDASLVGSAFDCEVSVLFLHDGAFQLLNQQNCEHSELKQYTKTFAALQDFGIENVYLHDLSLMARGINAEQILLEGDVVNATQISEIIAQQHRVFTF